MSLGIQGVKGVLTPPHLCESFTFKIKKAWEEYRVEVRECKGSEHLKKLIELL
jgi:hypothetical protein